MGSRVIKYVFLVLAMSVLSVARANSKEPSLCSSEKGVFTTNGDKVALSKLQGLHVSISNLDGICRIEAVEGLLWWRNGLLAAIRPVNTEGWIPFKVAYGFRMSPGINTELPKPRGTLRSPYWGGLTLNLTKYPSFQIRLSQNLDSTQSAGFKGNFVMVNFKGSDGRRKLVSCSVIATSLSSGKGRHVQSLAAKDLIYRDFSQDFDMCEMDLIDFSLKSGAGRISFSIEHLEVASLVIPQIFEFIDRAIAQQGDD